MIIPVATNKKKAHNKAYTSTALKNLKILKIKVSINMNITSV